MTLLQNYFVTPALFQNDTGLEAVVGNQVRLFLDQAANPDLPESILGVIQHPIVKASCHTMTGYSIEYDEADLLGAVVFIHPDDVIDAAIIDNTTLIYDAIEAEAAARVAADSFLAPKASPTFTGTPSAPTAGVGYYSTQLATCALVVMSCAPKAPLISPVFTTPSLGVATATTINAVKISSTTATGTAKEIQLGGSGYIQLSGTGYMQLGGALNVYATGNLTIQPGATLTVTNSSSLITQGAFSITLVSTATTVATFPAGTTTLASLAGAETLTNKTFSGVVKATNFYTVATLPAAATVGAGARAWVNDCTEPPSAVGTVLITGIHGGGTIFVPVFTNGANWIIG